MLRFSTPNYRQTGHLLLRLRPSKPDTSGFKINSDLHKSDGSFQRCHNINLYPILSCFTPGRRPRTRNGPPALCGRTGGGASRHGGHGRDELKERGGSVAAAVRQLYAALEARRDSPISTTSTLLGSG